LEEGPVGDLGQAVAESLSENKKKENAREER
jgi:hypothetical protein